MNNNRRLKEMDETTSRLTINKSHACLTYSTTIYTTLSEQENGWPYLVMDAFQTGNPQEGLNTQNSTCNIGV